MLYIENRFINLIGGLEAFHRRKYAAVPIPDKLQTKIKRVLDQIKATKDKRWLKLILSRAHVDEPDLAFRHI